MEISSINQHPNLNDRNEAINFARSVLKNKSDYLILDTETTGLGEKDVIIQLAIIDLDGNTLIDTYIRPTKRKSVPRDASAIHGIKYKDLIDAPTFVDILHEISKYLESNKKFLIYNFMFDARLINQTISADGIKYVSNLKGNCVMQLYSVFLGNWNPISKEYKFQKLPESNHSALEDCHATLKLIKSIAQQELSVIPDNYKPTAIKPKPGEGRLVGFLIGLLIMCIILIFLIKAC
jgi:DNA polymerase-3 subunit epsilon